VKNRYRANRTQHKTGQFHRLFALASLMLYRLPKNPCSGADDARIFSNPQLLLYNYQYIGNLLSPLISFFNIHKNYQILEYMNGSVTGSILFFSVF
jgi:hypothetical protein